MSLTMLYLTAHLLIFSDGRMPFWPTSDILYVANSAAEEWQKKPVQEDSSFFDIVDPEIYTMPGYKKVLYYVDEKPVLSIIVNLRTGQVMDDNLCIYFKNKKILHFSRQVQNLTKTYPIPIDELANQIGCDKLKIIK